MPRSILFAALLLTTGAAAAAPSSPLLARTDTGTVSGAREMGTIAFRGIPYAAPPVGSRRWRPPAPAARWDGVRKTVRYGAACPQAPDHKEAWAQVGPTSEDCLYLNVWRPAQPGHHPVMVFLHGGGFTYGSAGVPLYDGANLVRRGVVVVTLNYRLGLLGYFAHPALTREDPDGELGNYGVMDQIAALRWVRRNIAAFDGDPRNVTLFGESAGAGIVQTLMGTPQAAGLFEKAISESGAGGTVLTAIRGEPASAEAFGARWAESIGLKDATAAQLRVLPVNRLLGRSFPFIDGRVVTASPGAPFASGREAEVPLLIGANSNEATLNPNGEPAARKLLGDGYDRSLRAYVAEPVDGDPAHAAMDLAEDALSVMPSLSIAVMHAANGGAAYNFYFDQVPSNRRPGSAGTPHGGELEYVFGNPDAGSVWDAADRRVSDLTMRYFVQFARTGSPNGAGLPAWPRVNAETAPSFLVIGPTPHATLLSSQRERVRRASLAASMQGWRGEERP